MVFKDIKSEDQFHESISGAESDKVMVFCYQRQSQQCLQMMTVLEEMSEVNSEGSSLCLKVDIHQVPFFIEYFDIVNVPVIVILQNKEELVRYEGNDLQEVKVFVEKHLAEQTKNKL